MSALSKDYLENKDARCYYCGVEILEPPKQYGSHGAVTSYTNHSKFFVIWNNNPIIYLHPHCAEELALHLIKDVRTGESGNAYSYRMGWK